MGLISSISFASLLLFIAVQSVKKYLLIPTQKRLEPVGIWTHAVRAGEGTTALRITRINTFSKYAKFGGVTASSRKSICWYPHRKGWNLLGFETHAVRAGEGTTALRVLTHFPSTPSLVASLLAVAAEWREKSWLDS